MSDRDNPQLLDLAGVAELAGQLVADRGVLQVMSLGGAIGGMLQRVAEDGTRAWTLAAAAEHHGLDVPTGLACFALWRGCYESWALHAGDLRQAELASAQLELAPSTSEVFACSSRDWPT